MGERILSWQIFCNELCFLNWFYHALWILFGILASWTYFLGLYISDFTIAAKKQLLHVSYFWAMYKSSYVEQDFELLSFFCFFCVRCTLIQSLQQLLFASSTTAQPILTPRVQPSPLHFYTLCLLLKLVLLWLWLFVPSSFYIFPFYFLLVYVLFSIGIANNMILLFFLEVAPNDTIFPTIMVSHVISFTHNFWLKL